MTCLDSLSELLMDTMSGRNRGVAPEGLEPLGITTESHDPTPERTSLHVYCPIRGLQRLALWMQTSFKGWRA